MVNNSPGATEMNTADLVEDCPICGHELKPHTPPGATAMTLDPRLQKLNECDGLGDDIDKEVRDMAKRVHNAFPEIAEKHTEDEVYKKLLTDEAIANIINNGHY